MKVVHKKIAPVIDKGISKLKFMGIVEQLNKGLANGDKDRLKPPVQATLHRIVHLLSVQYQDFYFNDFLQKEHAHTLNQMDLSLAKTISYISNYNQKEGQEFTICTTRTTRNHLHKLVDHGLIIWKSVEGKTLILPHPELLQFTKNYAHLVPVFSQFFENSFKKQNPENKALQELIRKKIHTMYPSLETLSNKSINADVDNSQKRNLNFGKETICLETPKAETEKNINQKNLEQKKEKVPQKRKKELTPYQRQINQYLTIIWNWLMINCYSSSEYEFISKSQRSYFAKEIRAMFEFAGNPESKFKEIKARLWIWKKFLDDADSKGKHFTTPLPNIFFNPTNYKANSFHITKIYLSKDKKLKTERAVRFKANNFYKKFVEIQENESWTISQKIKKQKQLVWSMNLERKRNPEVVIAFEEKVSRYFTKDKFFKNYS